MDSKTFTLFDWIIWSGAALSLLGLLGLIWCIIKVTRAKRAGLTDDEMRAVLQRCCRSISGRCSCR